MKGLDFNQVPRNGFDIFGNLVMRDNGIMRAYYVAYGLVLPINAISNAVCNDVLHSSQMLIYPKREN